MSSPNEVDVVIVNYRCAADTLAAAAALVPWRFNLLWIVDNSADAAEAEALAAGSANLPWVRLVVAERNLGFGAACNLAFARSCSPFFLLLNPDARMGADAVAQLTAVLVQEPRWAAVSPRTYWDARQRFLLPLPSSQTPATATAWAALSRFPRFARTVFHRYLRTMQDCMAKDEPFPTSFLAGATLLLRRDAVLAAGGLFDPDYFMFFEDSELSLRLRRAGFRLGLAPQANAYHEYRHKAIKGPLMAASRQIYFRKCFPRFFRLSGELSRLDRLASPIDWSQWGAELAAPCASAQEFAAQLGDEGLVAFSPSPFLMPAIFRPRGAGAVRFDEDEWRMLEPGRYMAAVRPPAGNGPLRFVSFERAPL